MKITGFGKLFIYNVSPSCRFWCSKFG